MPMNTLRIFRPLTFFICSLVAQSALNAQDTTFLQRRPADVPAALKSFVDEYVQNGDTVSIFEDSGSLYLEHGYEPPRRIRTSRLNEFRIEGVEGRDSTVVFEALNAEEWLRFAGVRFRKLGYGFLQSFRISPLRPVAELESLALRSHPPIEQGDFHAADLVDVAKLDSSIHLEVRYATTNNFLGVPVYRSARAYLQKPAAEALVRAHRWLARYGFGLLIHDAYRPWYVTKIFWDATPDDKKIFVADPAKGSRHNRGCAVDLTLYELATGRPVEMPSGYDEFSPRAYPSYAGGTSLRRWHRALLQRAMERERFHVYEWEWWHFDFEGWERYPIINVTFDKIPKDAD